MLTSAIHDSVQTYGITSVLKKMGYMYHSLAQRRRYAMQITASLNNPAYKMPGNAVFLNKHITYKI